MKNNQDQYSDSEYSGGISYSYKKERITQIIFDWIIILGIFGVFILVYFLVDPKIRHFTCDESDIFLPYKSENNFNFFYKL